MLATLAPILATFVGFLGLRLASVGHRGTVSEAAAFTFLLGFGPFAGEVADVFLELHKSGVIALGALVWLVIALLVGKTRAGNAHWIVYAAATSAWLGVGLVELAYKGLGA